ncbi:MAG: hypothetical protein HQL71_12475 [Magnetococcales bacterium]|nr:hypothetical protein [Magnetococcales bacterium]
MKHIKNTLYIVAAMMLAISLTSCSSTAHNRGNGMEKYKNNTAGSPYTPQGYQEPVFVPIQ